MNHNCVIALRLPDSILDTCQPTVMLALFTHSRATQFSSRSVGYFIQANGKKELCLAALILPRSFQRKLEWVQRLTDDLVDQLGRESSFLSSPSIDMSDVFSQSEWEALVAYGALSPSDVEEVKQWLIQYEAGLLTSDEQEELYSILDQLNEFLSYVASMEFPEEPGSVMTDTSTSTPEATMAIANNTQEDIIAKLKQEKEDLKKELDDRSSASNTGATIGIVVGVLVVLALVIGAFVWKRRRRANRKSIVDEIATPKEDGTTDYSTIKTSDSNWTQGSAEPVESTIWMDPAIIAVRVPLEKIKLGDLISRGGFGEVYRGRYQARDVAIKRLLPERRKDMKQIKGFLAEIKLVSSMEHERIVHFVGIAWDSLSDLCVLTELMEGGDLRSLLDEFETEHRPHGFDKDKAQVAVHVAHALTYLHSLQPVILHRDLKSRNILLDANMNAKITDFGVSRENIDSTMTAGVGSSLWMAPEVLMGERYNEKADVFSFGVVLSELDTHSIPYANATEPGTDRKLPQTAILQMMTVGRLRVAFSSSAPSEMVELGLACVAVEPKDRPTAAEVLHRVLQVSRSI